MDDDNQHHWHQKRWLRLTALCLLPAIALGLYIISTRIAISKRPAVPVTPEPSAPNN